MINYAVEMRQFLIFGKHCSEADVNVLLSHTEIMSLEETGQDFREIRKDRVQLATLVLTVSANNNFHSSS